jgi:hypothetical protein
MTPEPGKIQQSTVQNEIAPAILKRLNHLTAVAHSEIEWQNADKERKKPNGTLLVERLSH